MEKSLKYNGDLNNLKTAGTYHAFGVQHNPPGTNNYGYVSVITHSSILIIAYSNIHRSIQQLYISED